MDLTVAILLMNEYKCVCACFWLTVFVHGVRLRLLLPNISKRAYDGDAVGQFFVVLVVMLFQQGFPDPVPSIWTERTRQLMLVQNHV